MEVCIWSLYEVVCNDFDVCFGCKYDGKCYIWLYELVDFGFVFVLKVFFLVEGSCDVSENDYGNNGSVN